MRPLPVLASCAIAAALIVMLASVAIGGNGKGAVNAAFKAGNGSFNIAVGTAAGAAPNPIPASVTHQSVQIFGYAGGPSEGRVYCGDVWNVIVTVTFGFPPDRPLLAELDVRQYLDGDHVGATDSHLKANQGFFDQRGWARYFGTFIPPGTMANGTHRVKQVVEHDTFGVAWDPPPLVFEVSSSAC